MITPGGQVESQLNQDQVTRELVGASPGSGGAVRYDHSPPNKKGKGQVYNAKQHEEKKKWKEVMKFMEDNPAILLELMPPTPGRRKAAVDASHNLLYNSSSKQFLDSQGLLRYQNNDFQGAGRRTGSYDSN